MYSGCSTKRPIFGWLSQRLGSVLLATAAGTAPAAEDVVILRDISWDTCCRLNDENWERTIGTLVQTIAWTLRLICQLRQRNHAPEGSARGSRTRCLLLLRTNGCCHAGAGRVGSPYRSRARSSRGNRHQPAVASQVSPSTPRLGSLRYGGPIRTRGSSTKLVDGEYRVIPASNLLPGMTGVRLAQLLADGRALPVNEWLSRATRRSD